jgi:hemerythrin
MAIELTPDMLTGNEEIDEQHRQIFDQANNLLAAASEQRAEEILADVIKFLEAHVIRHFHTEETAMLAYDFPGYDEHVLQHTELMRGVCRLRRKLDAEGPSKGVAAACSRLLVEFLVNHIRKSDREIADFFRSAL